MHNVQRDDVDPGLDVLQATLCYLMDRYTYRPSEHLAAAVVEHLERLVHHPEIVLLPVQQRLYARLLNRWRARAFTTLRDRGLNEVVRMPVH